MMFGSDKRGKSQPDGESQKSDSGVLLHELLNNVAAISTFCSLIKRDLDDARSEISQNIHDDIDEISEAARRANALGIELANRIAGDANG